MPRSVKTVNYTSELKKFVTSQYIYSGVRITFAIVLPGIILAYFGLLKDYFLFPLGTSFVGLTDMAGPFIRRRNALILAIFSFVLVAAAGSLAAPYTVTPYILIILFGIFFCMIGVYGQRLAAVGGLTLVVFSIFVDAYLSSGSLVKDLLIFAAGCVWFLIVFLIVSKIQPYKLAGQMIGENYLQLSEYLQIKARFYQPGAQLDTLYQEVIAKQVIIKNLQEETREVVFKTRTIVNESTTTSRLLMLMFLNSIDFYEKLITSDQDYQKIQEQFAENSILAKIHDFLILLSDEISNIGIAMQSGTKTVPLRDFTHELDLVYDEYFELRNRRLTPDNLEYFMSMRLILSRINDVTQDVKTIYKVFSQDLSNAKSLSIGLDLDKFVPKQEKLNLRVLRMNLSLKSSHFRHAIRMTLALLTGYNISQIGVLNIGHSYWILITIIAIMRPAYSTTKHRNLLRLYGTAAGAIVGYLLLTFVDHHTILLTILFAAMILCFSLLQKQYAWAVFFMTLYILITFNFLNPGNVNLIFKDRIVDTVLAGVIAFLISYFVLPVWEHTQNVSLMEKTAAANIHYFETVMDKLEHKPVQEEYYRMRRKDSIIHLANLSDNFQKMLSDPKNQRKKMETVHQFVNTSHLITAYTASLHQYTTSGNHFSEIDLNAWKQKITAEMQCTMNLLQNHDPNADIPGIQIPLPEDNLVDELMLNRKKELTEKEIYDVRDPNKITRLTELNNIREILELLYDVAHEQRKVIEHYREIRNAMG